ncbi:MAG: hypothetical protein IKD09_07025 [Lentisphaeria bacterium]|nr:hypothetical protein [Lentisphaeria bacterium]
MKFLSKFALTTLLIFSAMMIFAKDTVYWIPQFSEFKEISENDLLFLKKTLKKAEQNQVKAVICELDTPGGRIDVALRYISIFAKSEIPTVVYLNPQGISAGMIIALGADKIAINPMGVIGDAMPLSIGFDGATPIVEEQTDKTDKTDKTQPQKVEKNTAENKNIDNLEKLIEDAISEKLTNNKGDEKELKRLADQKFLTVYYKILQVLAEKNNRPVEVIRATSDPYVKLSKEVHGIDHAGKSPLTLSAAEAKKLNVVDYIANDREDLLTQLNLANAEVEVIEPTPFEQIIGFLTHGAISGILIALGLIGIFIEIKTPGFGIAGTLGLLCLVLFFVGHIYSGASEWGPLVIFFVGLILLLLEIFVIPGFGLVGILGIGCIVASFITAFGFERINTAIQTVALALLGSITAMILLAIYVLPKTSLFRHLSLSAVSGDTAKEDASKKENASELIGAVGITVTPLRPNGKIKIANELYEAISVMGFISADTTVKVVDKTSFELKVAPLSETDHC